MLNYRKIRHIDPLSKSISWRLYSSLLTFTQIDTMNPAEVAQEFVIHTDMHVFLTGKAGTGKTTLLRKIAEESHKNMVITAPRGCLLYTSDAGDE